MPNYPNASSLADKIGSVAQAAMRVTQGAAAATAKAYESKQTAAPTGTAAATEGTSK